MSDRNAHWERVYASRGEDEVSWFQRRPEMSLALIERSGLTNDAPMIDIGAGASTLVDHLLDAGYTAPAVLDIAASALRRSRQRLGERATRVDWIESDVLTFAPSRRYALWHDRAVLHFLVEAGEREGYLHALRTSVALGGQVIVATFAHDGPARCSGLPVARYDAAGLHAIFGIEYELLESAKESHYTPSGTEQRFTWVRMRRSG
jgi:hypothetical protein